MREYLKFYIDGRWVEPAKLRTLDVVNPATEEVCGRIALGSVADVNRAVHAARAAFVGWSQTSRENRLDVMQRVIAEYQRRFEDLAFAVSEEMGAPAGFAQGEQVPAGLGALSIAADALTTYPFEEHRGETLIVKEPIGVCGLITPWNWPLFLIATKVAPALATGCTMVLKPSEVAPFSGQLFAEIMDAAGVPAGVFNLVQGTGSEVGVALSSHPGIDMISFTGSTRAGIEVARNAAPTVKRVQQELGGKSPDIILDDEGFAGGVSSGVQGVMQNSGQSCNAPTRMLVPVRRMEEAIEVARHGAEKITVGNPGSGAMLGPVVSEMQWNKIQGLIQQGIDEGATLVIGGLGRPEGLEKGYYVRPTVFANVHNNMTVAREEIFGPVLVILGYETLDEAVELANDTEYGLAAYVHGTDIAQVRTVALRLRTGQVLLNDAFDLSAPFGGYKKSGNGREWGDFAFSEYLEVKAMVGYLPKQLEINLS